MVKSNVIKLPPAMQAEMREQVRVDRARENNKQVALALVAAGIPVLFTNPKTKRPLVVAHTTLDTDMSEEEREANRREFFDEHRFDPLHVGCTVDRATVRRILRAKPDATPAISCGPAGLIVIDNDVKERDGVLRNGVEEFDAFCEPHGGIPAGAIVVESQGKGRHLYFANTESRGSSAGILKRQCETDVKGAGGYVVAPGVIRPHDGRAYGSRRDLEALIEARSKSKLAPIPKFIADAIGARGEDNANTTNERDIQALVDRLRQAELPDGGDLLEPALDGLDFDKLTARYEKLHSAIEASDRSDVRFNLAVALKTERPQTTAEEFAAIVMAREECGTFVDEEKPSQGEYDWRNIARDWSRAMPHKSGKSSDGEEFGAVDDESDGETAGKSGKVVHLADIRTAKTQLLDWSIKHFIARGTTSIVSGQWGAGKTAVFVDIGLHVAAGLPWRDRKVKKGVVLYVGLENPEDVSRRVRAWCDLKEAEGVDISECAFVLHKGPLSLVDLGGKATRGEAELIKIANEASKRYGVPVGMIVIDTVSQSIAPGNDRDHAALYVKALLRISQATGANTTALHHPTKAGDPFRGGGEFQGDGDTVILLAMDAHRRGTIKAGTKFRIGDARLVDFRYRLKPHFICKDEDGEDVTVILAAEDHETPMPAVDDTDDEDIPLPPDTPADKLRATLRALEECAAEQAEITGDAITESGVSKGQVFARLNRDRKSAGLAVLKDPTIATRLLDKLVKAGQAVRVGANRRTEYRVVD